jgi:hypothetical protein
MGGTILLVISVQKLPKETNLLTHVRMDITLKLRSSGITVLHATNYVSFVLFITNLMLFLLKVQT